jgi:phospholipid/cholesterol/gamma-HCH transport system permease protein
MAKSDPHSTVTAQNVQMPWGLRFDQRGEGLLMLLLSGSWRVHDGLPATDLVEPRLMAGPPVRRIAFDTRAVGAWDSGLLVFLLRVVEAARRHGVTVDGAGLPEGARRLFDLASAVPPKEGARRTGARQALLAQIGEAATEIYRGAHEALSFLGEASLALFNWARRRARYRRSDLLVNIQQVGPEALPIVSLISFLVGLILAFVGAVQLRQFGAQIYVADLVGLGMVREMGPIMAGIIMAGRTGAAFAAQLGTMQVNEEVDAFKTLGIAPMEFLVLPRMLALMLMMPLLTVYADMVGIFGGFVVGVGMLDLSPVEYFNETQAALDLTQFAIGIVKSVVFGVLIAVAGCMRGIQCGRSAAAVGAAATSAVVLGIVLIVVWDGIFAVALNAIGI